MPKVSMLQPSFASGEFAPLTQGRTDSERYKSALNVTLNYLPTIQGPLVRRPGTRYITNVKNQSDPAPVLIPFQFSQSQAYMLEFGQNYIRFYQNNGQIVTSGTTYQVSGYLAASSVFTFNGVMPSLIPNAGQVITANGGAVAAGIPLEISTPYSIFDVPQIKWAQNGDVLYLVHPSYRPMKLRRFGTFNWTLDQLTTQDGPYLGINSYKDPADSARITLTYNGSVTTGPSYSISACANNGSGAIRVTTSAANSYQSGDRVWITGVVGATQANNTTYGFWPITVISSTQFDLVGSTFSSTYTSGGTVYPALFVNGTGDIGRPMRVVMPAAATNASALVGGPIVSVTNAATATFAPVSPYSLGSVAPPYAISFFYFGVWYPGNYPSAISFHQNRLALGGTPNQPQQVDISATGDYEMFPPTKRNDGNVADSNAMQFTLASSDQNRIQWLSSEAQGLLAGTQSSEWSMAASASNQAMTPTNFNAAQTSYFGSLNAPCVQAGNATLYIQRSGRKIREMNYFFQVGTFRSTDLTELSEHITLPTVTRLAVVKDSQPIVWGMRSDGLLCSMTYNRDDQTLKAGWARHQLGGRSDSAGSAPQVKAIASIPAPDGTYDQVWMVVRRYLNGAFVQTVEYLTKIYDDNAVVYDSYHFDCGATLDNNVVFGEAPGFVSVTTGTTTTFTTQFAHGLTTGTAIRFSDVVGLNIQTTDIDGNVTTTNLVNDKPFLVGAVTSTTFTITDQSSVAINSTGYSAYVGNGLVRKLLSNVAGLTWLKNETVSVLVDGGVHRDVVVSNTGTIALDVPGGRIQVGYSYNSDGQSLRSDAGSAQGSSLGKTRRPFRFGMLVRNVGDLSTGYSFTTLKPFNFQRADFLQADSAGRLYSGVMNEFIEAPYDYDGGICWRQSTGLPGTIQSLDVMLEEFDV